jgi:hypothetical protein
MREHEHTNERLDREWRELYERILSVLAQYGQNDIDGGDYFLANEIFSSYVHQIEMHELHMLRPDIIKSLHILLRNYPDWEIEISIFVPREDITIEPGEGLTLRDDEIVDALDRTLLPEEYRDLKYEGGRPPKGPGDIAIFGDR